MGKKTKSSDQDDGRGMVRLRLANTRERREAVELPDFLRRLSGPSLEARQRSVEQALVLLEQLYVNLLQKESLYAAEPVRRLRLLLFQLEREAIQTEEDLGAMRTALLPEEEDPRTTTLAFYTELADVFSTVRDLHTGFALPGVANLGRWAVLGIDVEACYETDANGHRRRKYIVSKAVHDAEEEPFEPGVEVVAWNGVPIERAVALNAERFAGSNPAARHARGVSRLTIRAVGEAPLPDEDWVVVSYLPSEKKSSRKADPAGAAEPTPREVRLDWFVAADRPVLSIPLPATAGIDQAIDAEGEIVQQAKRLMFAANERDVGAELDVSCTSPPSSGPSGFDEITGSEERWRPLRCRVRAWVLSKTPEVGYVRIYRFRPAEDLRALNDFEAIERFLDALQALIEQLESDGVRRLILDVRDNPGGSVRLAEQVLQLFSPRRIEPAPFQLRNTPLALQLCRLNDGEGRPFGADFRPWLDSLEQARETGADYSDGIPLTDPIACNARGQIFHGPVALVTSALSYSATDVFAAGFQDHRIGPVVGVDETTGAGGANVYDHEVLRQLLPGLGLEPLPRGMTMRVALRRALRVGERAGTVLEDLGVRPDERGGQRLRHFLTADDLRHSNRDLITFVTGLLAREPLRRLDVTEGPSLDQQQLTMTVESEGIESLDVYAEVRTEDGGTARIVHRALGSKAVDKSEEATATTQVELVLESLRLEPGAVLRVEGFSKNKLVASRRVEIAAPD